MADKSASPARAGDPLINHSPDQPLGTEELLQGFHAAHRRIGETAAGAVEASTNVFALAELLIKKGVIGLDELESVRRVVGPRIEERAKESLAVQLADGAPNKYEMDEQTVEIDCENRVHLCKAACCRLRFALSEQDVEEGVVNWSISEPYLNRQVADGYCSHSDPGSRRCNIYTNRPGVCRAYDCRNDHRIWVDFEQRIPNPRLLEETNGVTPPVTFPPAEAETS
jgi:Fe-S-cluster containining protein